MSYDIMFAVKPAGAPDGVYAAIGEPESAHPTYNVGEILRRSMDWDFDQGEWYSVTEVIPKIEKGIHELRFNGQKYKEYEPDNGYGDIGTALRSLEAIINWLSTEKEWTWNAEVPIECIYVRW